MQQSAYKIYNASAGSGKTYTLAKSYLKILVKANSFDQFKTILAITFTNKAVGEMKERIINMLKSFSSPSNLDDPHPMFVDICRELSISSDELYIKSRHILKHIIHNYGAFDITTIDGFTHRIIRTFAHDLKLSVNFEVELDQDRLLNEAVERLIAKAGSDKQLTNILVDFAIEKADDDKSWDISYDFNKIAKLLVSENDIKALQSIKDKTLTDFKKLKQRLVKEISLLEKEIQNISDSTLNLIEECGLQFDDFNRKLLPNHFKHLGNKNFSIGFEGAWQTDLLEGNKLYPKRVTEAVADTINSIQPNLSEAYSKTRAFIFQRKLKSGFYKNITPLSVLNVIKNELDALKEEQNLMLISEFNQIISKEIKGQPTPFIYERLGEKFKHYFIDEFQDTSKMQWENLIPLLENALSVSNGTAMLVGDAKQAIYRWRGGEAEQFINLYNGKENPFNIDPDVLSLNINFRSSQAIIEFNNSFFDFLGNHSFTNSNYADLYKKAHQKKHNEKEGFVNLKFLDIKKEDDTNQLYSQEVLETIKQSLSNGYTLKDICVLVRKRKEGVAIANYLSENDITIASSETLLLYNSEKVVFIDAFLKLLIQPNNDSLKIEVLSFLAKQNLIQDLHGFFSQHLKTSVDLMLDSLKSLHIHINKSDLLQLPLYELVEQLVRTFNLNSTSDAYLQFYLDVVLEFAQKHNSDIAVFVDYFEKKKDSLSIVSPENINAVRIMTIHKSKGLEFPIVIFPFADLNIYKEVDPKIWYPINEDEYNGFKTLLLSFNKDVGQFNETGKHIYDEHRSQLELDNINLLYVVLTRAISQLYIISKTDIDSKGQVNTKSYAGMFISYLQSQNLWAENTLNYSFGASQLNDESPKAITKPIPLKFISTPKEDHNLSIITKSGLLWDTKQESAIERGNLVHLTLSKIKTTNDIDFALTELLTSGEISMDKIESLKSMVLKVIEHPKLKAYYQDTFIIYNERDIITSSGQLIRPDRLNINSNNEAILIDYKTGEEQSSHKTQLNGYECILQQMNLNVILKLLVYLNDDVDVIEV